MGVKEQIDNDLRELADYRLELEVAYQKKQQERLKQEIKSEKDVAIGDYQVQKIISQNSLYTRLVNYIKSLFVSKTTAKIDRETKGVVTPMLVPISDNEEISTEPIEVWESDRSDFDDFMLEFNKYFQSFKKGIEIVLLDTESLGLNLTYSDKTYTYRSIKLSLDNYEILYAVEHTQKSSSVKYIEYEVALKYLVDFVKDKIKSKIETEYRKLNFENEFNKKKVSTMFFKDI